MNTTRMIGAVCTHYLLKYYKFQPYVKEKAETFWLKRLIIKQ